MFPAGAQSAPPAFGSVTSSTQLSVFGQQATPQPGFGSSTSSAGECRRSSSLLVSEIIYFTRFFMKRTLNCTEKEDLCLPHIIQRKNRPL